MSTSRDEPTRTELCSEGPPAPLLESPEAGRATAQETARVPVAGLTCADADRYEDEGLVARGGMGSIRSVVDRLLLRREAMKILDAPRGKAARVTERFLEEARLTGSLDHPNIVPIYDIGLAADGSPAFITMKLVEGHSFADHIDRLGEARLHSEILEGSIQILVKVCDALSFAHGRGILHCDIKPGNIMVGSHGQVYLMDWGLASTTPAHARTSVGGWSPRPPKPSTITGTPAYMAPEQANGRHHLIDERTDVFLLGGTLYRMLTGRPPYSEATPIDTVRRAQQGGVIPAEKVVTGGKLPPELCRITMKALETDREKRYPSVDAMKEDLEKFLRGGGWLPTYTFDAGEVIVQEGDTAEAAFIIVEGQCEAYKTVGDERVKLRVMGPGEVFGEAAVFTSQTRTASVMALSKVTVKVVTAESLDRELSRNAWLTALVKALAGRFRELDAELGRRRQV